MKRNTFEDICYQLNKCNCACNIDEITCVKEVLNKRINKNYTKFLEIKAESRKSSIDEFINMALSLSALIVAFYSLGISLLPNTIVGENGKLIAFGLIGLYLAYVIYKIASRRYLTNWAEYVIVVLEEIEKDEEYLYKKDNK